MKGRWRMCETLNLELKLRPKGRGGKGTLMAVLNGAVVHADELTVTDADDRERFERALCDDRPGIDASAVRDKLLSIAASLADGADEDDPNQSAMLVDLAGDAALFHTTEGEAFATVPVHAHRETYLVNGRTFKLWLQRRFYEAFGKPPGSQAMQAGLGILTGKAIYDGEEHPTVVRLGWHGDAIYLDLADGEWRAVRVTAEGWQVVADPPVKSSGARGCFPCWRPSRAGASMSCAGSSTCRTTTIGCSSRHGCSVASAPTASTPFLPSTASTAAARRGCVGCCGRW